MKHIWIIALSSLLFVSCHSKQSQQEPTTRRFGNFTGIETGNLPETRIKPKPTRPDLPVIPLPQYTKIKDEPLETVKRTVLVRLPERVGGKELYAIALKVKEESRTEFDRTFITYLLPDMPAKGGAWATSHFDPKLKVRILGLTVEQFQKLCMLPDEPGLVGKWIVKGAAAHRLAIFRMGDDVVAKSTFKNGGSAEVKVSPKPDKRFDVAGGTVHYQINAQGNLELHGQTGLFAVGEAISGKGP